MLQHVVKSLPLYDTYIFLGGFLTRLTDSTLHRSIYLSRQLELSMGVITICAYSMYTIRAFLNTNAICFLEKK